MDCRAYAVAGLAFLIAGAGIAGCGSGGGAADQRKNAPDEELRRYEATFRPSEFDPPPAVVLQPKTSAAGDTSARPPELPTEPASEYVPGFRVQIFSSTDIDEANGVKAAAEEKFPLEWFYVVYEPPTYKVRAGDFQQRYDADRLARTLREGGYTDSWIVPDRVVKQPPVKVPPPPREEGQK